MSSRGPRRYRARCDEEIDQTPTSVIDWLSGPLNRGIRRTAYCSSFQDYDGLLDNRRTQAAHMLRSAPDYQGIKALTFMAERAYLVRFKGARLPPELVIAEAVEFHGDHLAFLRSDGSLAALMALEIVENWSEVNP
jgi:hypothetical protein